MRKIYVIVLFLISCSLLNNKNTYGIASKDNNVAKKLSGKVLLYGIFVDSKDTYPFSDFDIKSTEDSVRKATAWLERQAKENGVSLEITILFHDNNGKKPISEKFSKKTLSKTLYTPNLKIGIKNIDKWADKVAKKAQPSLGKSESEIIATQNSPSNRERLVARLRDKYEVENVALVYFINNYHNNELSVAFHTNYNSVEYAIVSYKRTGVIAHEFLHLFGAWDLYHDPLKSKKENKKLQRFRNKYPNTIMSEAANIAVDSLTISPITKYLIGWSNELNPEDTKLLFGKKVGLSKY